MAGPLQGLKVIEMAGIGPGPFCAMLLADMGAEVVRIARPGTQPEHVAVGAIEPQFYALLRERCGIADDPVFDPQMDAARWPSLKLRMADLFRTRTRDEWCALLEGSDACFAPVLDWDEAPRHPHNVARGTFATVDGVVQPAPAPRFSRTPSQLLEGRASARRGT